MALFKNILTGKILDGHKEMNLSILTLRFRGNREEEFKDYYFNYSIDFVRISLIFSILFYMSFYFLDAVIFPTYKFQFLIIRLIVCIPLAFSVVMFSYRKRFKKLWQSILFVLVQTSGFGIILMILYSDEAIQRSYYVGLLLVLIYNYIFSKLTFLRAVLAGWSLFLLYIVSVNLKSDIPFSENFMNTFFFAGVNIFGMFASYFIDYYSRREFYTITLLINEKKKVEDLNENLEVIVQQRTLELQETNERLSSKNNDLMISEIELNKHKTELEELIRHRTTELEKKYIELEDKNNELERMNLLFVGREFRIKELREKIKELEK